MVYLVDPNQPGTTFFAAIAWQKNCFYAQFEAAYTTNTQVSFSIFCEGAKILSTYSANLHSRNPLEDLDYSTCSVKEHKFITQILRRCEDLFCILGEYTQIHSAFHNKCDIENKIIFSTALKMTLLLNLERGLTSRPKPTRNNIFCCSSLTEKLFLHILNKHSEL